MKCKFIKRNCRLRAASPVFHIDEGDYIAKRVPVPKSPEGIYESKSGDFLLVGAPNASGRQAVKNLSDADAFKWYMRHVCSWRDTAYNNAPLRRLLARVLELALQH
jgi:hypothetical protein